MQTAIRHPGSVGGLRPKIPTGVPFAVYLAEYEFFKLFSLCSII